jgi:hypothetical protein
MGWFNLRQASLLDASGELGDPARQKLALRLLEDPVARRRHENARDNLALLQILPIPEPSASERRAIPAMIKRAIRLALLEEDAAASGLPAPSPDRPARRWARWSAGALAMAACAAIVASLAMNNQSHHARQSARIAQINAAIDHAMMAPDPSALAGNVVPANRSSFAGQLPQDAPTLSFLRDNQGTLHIAPIDADDPSLGSDPASPPG